MSADRQAPAYSEADAEQLAAIHAQHIGRALMADDRARQEVVATLMAGLANAIAFFSGPDDHRAANVAGVVEDLPTMVERCHAEITSIRGYVQ